MPYADITAMLARLARIAEELEALTRLPPQRAALELALLREREPYLLHPAPAERASRLRLVR
ncbi:MAG: hypothetical protein ACM33U_09030 [Solirubrobacterales bacterium]|nr:hypothetical protein [Solirubrobacterales bacterium]